ncbi:MAG: hypothetical protein GY749_02105 [Desulfobacteraceae bacterium]|nr:hypothetical protein [Desulfobacteraceae bacterium]
MNNLVPTLCVGMQSERSASWNTWKTGTQSIRPTRTRSVRAAFPRRAWERGRWVFSIC